MENLSTLPLSHTEAGGPNVADILEPAVLLLSGQRIVFKAAPEAPLYELSGDVTSIPQMNSSIIFERVEDAQPTEADTDGPEKQQKRHIFYLAHPAGAEFQTDTPAYYITSVTQEGTLGNIGLRPAKNLLQRPEFEVVLSAARTAADRPLFDENPQVIFNINPKMLTGRYTWIDSDGSQLAVEEQKRSHHTLDITVPMRREARDTLVATWCLKVWHDTAESPQAKKDAMERLTPAEGMLGYGNMSKTSKRAGALGSLVGAG